jgi:hypothetical protein
MRDCPAPGGEPDFAPSSRLREATSGGPLCRVRGHLGNFASTSTRSKNVSAGGSRELPSATHLPKALIRLHPAIELRNRWGVPGSRLLLHVSAGSALRRNSRGRRGAGQSGPPDVASRSLDDGAKSGSPPGVGNKHALSTCHRFRERFAP